MCQKVAHATKKYALIARAKQGRKQLFPYRCPRCDGRVWHLGHPKKRLPRLSRLTKVEQWTVNEGEWV